LQRDLKNSRAVAVTERLEQLSDDFEISRTMSEVIRFASLKAMYGKELSPEDEQAGLKLHEEMESIKQRRLQEFMLSRK